ncbi:MAG: translocation/assembly module TamB domain-containing protein, partial [Verrucomicrobiota bacterium]
LDPQAGVPFMEQPGNVLLDLTFSNLPIEEVFPLFSAETPVAGRLNGSLSNDGSWAAMNATGDLDFHPSLEQAQGEPALDLKLALGGAATRPESWMADLTAILSGLKYGDLQVGDVRLMAKTREQPNSKQLDVIVDAEQAGATIDAEAELDLTNAVSMDILRERPLSIEALIDAPDLASLWQQLAPPKWRTIPIAGALEVNLTQGRIQGSEVLDGNLEVFSDSLTIDGETLHQIDLKAQVSEPNHLNADLALEADEMSRAIAVGHFHLVEQSYQGEIELTLDLKSEGVLKRLLGRREIARLLPGQVSLLASAEGSVPDQQVSGEFQLSGGDLILADGGSPITHFATGGQFSETSLDLDLTVKSEPLDLNGEVLWDGEFVSIPTLTASAAGQQILEAEGSIPLTLETLAAETWIRQDKAINFNIVSQPTEIRPLMKLLNQTPPVNATVDLDLQLEGTPALPDVELNLAIAKIALAEQDNLKVGEVDLRLTAEGKRADLKGEYRHPDVNPLTIRASAPFFPQEWALKQRDITAEKIQLTARMERSSLAFLTTQVPAIKSIDGFLSLDAEVTGTMRTPVISGDGSLEVSRMRFQDRNAPSLYDVVLKTRFADNRLLIETLNAIVAGGEVAANGSIAFVPEQEPRFDLQLGAREALIFRTPDLSVRTDATLKLTGPFSAATLAGEVGLNNCRFFKNFDLLPQAMPVRKTSALPTVERAPRGGGAAYTDLNVGVDVEPFSNWNADVRIFTKTPFQVRSNLVESDLVTDIRVTGKLAAPTPSGFLAIDQGELSLPFSSVDVEIGRVEFDQHTGFNGALNFKAKAKADEYRINIYLHNNVLDPKFVLTSNPPLPTEDLMTLLVAGTTRDALIGGNTGSLAASKAATLLFKNMRKASAAADSEPSLLDNLQERTELDIGGINPETGAQTVAGKVRLWKQLFFVGDVDAENDYRALLKYVFRFR